MICSVKFGFSEKAALKDLEGRRFPTPALECHNIKHHCRGKHKSRMN
jgi:hypothetical protein